VFIKKLQRLLIWPVCVFSVGSSSCQPLPPTDPPRFYSNSTAEQRLMWHCISVSLILAIISIIWHSF